jgi:hypothetical protein
MSAQRIGDELRREAAPGERGAGRQRGGDAGERAAPPQRVGREGDRSQGRQGARERPAAEVVRGRGRRDGGEARDADDDRRDGEHVARADALMQAPRPQHEQQREAEGERGLHDGERGEQQRGGLQRPAEHPERGAGEPARAARQVPHERRAQLVRGRHHPRLERLQRDAEVVHGGGGACGRGAENDRGHDSTPR